MDKEVRWKQRFENYEKAFRLLEENVAKKNLTQLQRAGLIHFFEMTLELSWKLLKDYLEAKGYRLIGPKDVLKQAFQLDLIHNGHDWMDALDARNLTVHTYDEKLSLKAEKLISNKFFPLFKDLLDDFKKQL